MKSRNRYTTDFLGIVRARLGTKRSTNVPNNSNVNDVDRIVRSVDETTCVPNLANDNTS